MTALVLCPDCGGAGEIEDCQGSRGYICSHTNHRVWKCWTCDQSGEVRADQVDLEGEFIPDSCECDGERACRWPQHVMEQEQEEKQMAALYRAGKLTPRPVEDWKYADSLMNAGRGHLLSDEQKATWESGVPF